MRQIARTKNILQGNTLKDVFSVSVGCVSDALLHIPHKGAEAKQRVVDVKLVQAVDKCEEGGSCQTANDVSTICSYLAAVWFILRPVGVGGAGAVGLGVPSAEGVAVAGEGVGGERLRGAVLQAQKAPPRTPTGLVCILIVAEHTDGVAFAKTKAALHVHFFGADDHGVPLAGIATKACRRPIAAALAHVGRIGGSRVSTGR